MNCEAELSDVPKDVRALVLIELDFDDLQSMCKSNRVDSSICASDQFKLMYIDRDPERIKRVISTAFMYRRPHIMYRWGLLTMNRIWDLNEITVESITDLFISNVHSHWDYFIDFCRRFELASASLNSHEVQSILFRYAPPSVIDLILKDFGGLMDLEQLVNNPHIGYASSESLSIVFTYQKPTINTLKYIWQFHSPDNQDRLKKTKMTLESADINITPRIFSIAVQRGYADVVKYVMSRNLVQISTYDDLTELYDAITNNDRSQNALQMAQILIRDYKIDFGNISRIQYLPYSGNAALVFFLLSHPTIWTKLDRDAFVREVLSYPYIDTDVFLTIHHVFAELADPQYAADMEKHSCLNRGIKSDAMLLSVARFGIQTVRLALRYYTKANKLDYQVAVRSAVLRRDRVIFGAVISHKGVLQAIDIKETLQESINRAAPTIAEYIVASGLVRNVDLTEYIALAEQSGMPELAELMRQTQSIEPNDTKRSRLFCKVHQ